MSCPRSPQSPSSRLHVNTALPKVVTLGTLRRAWRCWPPGEMNARGQAHSPRPGPSSTDEQFSAVGKAAHPPARSRPLPFQDPPVLVGRGTRGSTRHRHPRTHTRSPEPAGQKAAGPRLWEFPDRRVFRRKSRPPARLSVPGVSPAVCSRTCRSAPVSSFWRGVGSSPLARGSEKASVSFPSQISPRGGV